MNKEEFIGELANRTGFTKVDLRKIVGESIKIIYEELSSGGYLKIVGFGVLKTRVAQTRVGRNPSANAKVLIPERTIPAFIPGSELKKVCEQIEAGSRKEDHNAQ